MKSQRRHELQENVLSAEITQVVNFLRKRGGAIAWGVLIAALIFFVIVYARSRSQQKTARLQADFERATVDPNLPSDQRVRLLEELSEQDDDERLAALATLELGIDCAARMNAAGPATDPVEWKGLADRAAVYYRKVISEFADRKLAVAKAHLGLGKLAESRGDFEAASAEYQAVLRISELSSHPIAMQTGASLRQLGMLARPVQMATTAPTTQPASQPATQPASGPETLPATQQAAVQETQPSTEVGKAAATQPAD